MLLEAYLATFFCIDKISLRLEIDLFFVLGCTRSMEALTVKSGNCLVLFSLSLDVMYPNSLSSFE